MMLDPLKKLGALLAVLVTLLLLSVACVAQATYYFDFSGGNDSNAGTRASPKKTLAWFNANAEDGDTALIQGGDTDTGQFAPAVGNTTLGSWGTGRGIIDPTASEPCVDLDGVSGTTIVNVELTGGTYGIYARAAVARTTVVDCSVHDNTQNGFGTADNSVGTTGDLNAIYNSDFVDNTSDGIGSRGSLHLYVEGGTVSGNGDDGISAHEESMIHAVGVTVFGNEDGFHHVSVTGTCIIDRCWIYGNTGGDGVSLNPSGTYVDAKVIVRNSIVSLPAAGAVSNDSCVRVINEGALEIDGCVLQNLNTTANRTMCVYATDGSSVSVSVTNTAMLTSDDVDAKYLRIGTGGNLTLGDWDNNVYLGGLATNTSPYFYLDVNRDFDTWRSLTGKDDNSREASDLGLTDAAGLATLATNAKPTAGSVLIGRGYARTASTLYDYTGSKRDGLAPWDIGAFANTLSTVAETTGSVDNTDRGVHYTTATLFSRGWSIGDTSSYLDISAGAGTDATRTGGGTRLVLTCGTPGLVKIVLGYGTTPASLTDGRGAFTAGAIVHSFPAPLDIRTGTKVTSIAAIGGTQLSNVSVMVY